MPDFTRQPNATVRDRLQQYGLSETEADTYLAVVETGPATARTVAETAGISTSYVYDICDSLAADGFVTVDDHRTPTVIRATPPSEAFGALKRELDTLETAVQSRYEDNSTEDNSFEVVKSRPTIVKRLEQHIDAADCEVVLQLPARRLPDLREPLRRARERGILVLLTLSGYDPESMPLELDGVANAVRLGLDGAPSLLATDQQRGLVSPATMLSWDHDETNAITFTQEAVAAVLVGSYLGNYWPIGEEVLVSRPPSLPVRYDMFRHVVFTTTLALRAGESVVADLYARPTGSDGEFEMLTGKVVDVRQNLLEPTRSDFGFENSLVIDTGQERITVGGYGAFLEDYEVKHTTLRRA
ncbi:transcriptional regulator [Haloarcula sp. CBA1130]|uniref:TrmB family transcriptional regulator sugar-binding domain-containing protein n=1 Tax=unclassified Haloarcula TaxID=2624677 RepID=UPI001246F38A|nr:MULTISPECIES: TrmB family transcriptional regulator sugar-binding domain-containing protein [unclassified Haloarcula]KAA9398595.1 transcriptional regulator [Haloarcula sp. CBA1129]KAA9403111.1 transcriptional regulator [Haloarcula sp. CBA1130]